MSELISVNLKTVEEVKRVLRGFDKPVNVYQIQKTKMKNYNSIKNALLYLVKEGKVRKIEVEGQTFWQLKKKGKNE